MYSGVYLAHCVDATQHRVLVPQLFGKTAATLHSWVIPPEAGQDGWVSFVSGQAAYPVWLGSRNGDAPTSGVVQAGSVTPPQLVPPAEVSTYLAGVAISGHRLVLVGEAGRVFPVQPSNLAHVGRAIGMTTQAVGAEEWVTVQASGPVVESGWAWDTSLPLFLGADGQITQVVPTYPSSAFLQRVAYPATATEIVLDLSPDPVILS